MQGNYRLYKKIMWVNKNKAHMSVNEDKKEIYNYLRQKGGFVFRNDYDFDCGEETYFWHVIKDYFGGLEELSSKMRNQVK